MNSTTSFHPINTTSDKALNELLSFFKCRNSIRIRLLPTVIFSILREFERKKGPIHRIYPLTKLAVKESFLPVSPSLLLI